VSGAKRESGTRRTDSGVRPVSRRVDAEAALRALRAEYARALPDRVAGMARCVRTWQEAPGDMRKFEEARVMAHRLRGTVGSYGLVEAGARIGEVEDALVRAAIVYAETAVPLWDDLDEALCVALDHALVASRAVLRAEDGGA